MDLFQSFLRTHKFEQCIARLLYLLHSSWASHCVFWARYHIWAGHVPVQSSSLHLREPPIPQKKKTLASPALVGGGGGAGRRGPASRDPPPPPARSPPPSPVPPPSASSGAASSPTTANRNSGHTEVVASIYSSVSAFLSDIYFGFHLHWLHLLPEILCQD